MILPTLPSVGLTDRIIAAQFAMANVSVVQCRVYAEPWVRSYSLASPSVLATPPQGLFPVVSAVPLSTTY